jgi:hypothetical protein
MAFHGDLSSFALPELLQWLDSSRKTGTLQMTWEGVGRRLLLRDGRVFATSAKGLWERTARMLKLADPAVGESAMRAFQELRGTSDAVASFAAHNVDVAVVSSLAREELYGAVVDLTLADDGEFHWSEDTETAGDEWLPLDMSLRALVFEALRWMDEAREVDGVLSSDSIRIKAKVVSSAEQPIVTRIMLRLCEPAQSLGQVRLTMGMSRTSGARRIFDLMRQGLLEVEGAGALEDDPLALMLENGLELVRQKQFDAASLIFSALLQADPADRRVREFARIVEAEHIAALYADMPPLTVLELVNDPEGLKRLRPEDRLVANLVNGIWDVSTITLASSVREIDTLKALNRLVRMGLIRRSQSPPRR